MNSVVTCIPIFTHFLQRSRSFDQYFPFLEGRLQHQRHRYAILGLRVVSPKGHYSSLILKANVSNMSIALDGSQIIAAASDDSMSTETLEAVLRRVQAMDAGPRRHAYRRMLWKACERRNSRFIWALWASLRTPFSDPAKFVEKAIQGMTEEDTEGRSAEVYRPYLMSIVDDEDDGYGGSDDDPR